MSLGDCDCGCTRISECVHMGGKRPMTDDELRGIEIMAKRGQYKPADLLSLIDEVRRLWKIAESK